MANPYTSCWVSDKTNSSFTVCGQLVNNGTTRNELTGESNRDRVTLEISADGTNWTNIYDGKLGIFGYSDSPIWSTTYDVGTSPTSRSYQARAWFDSTGYDYGTNPGYSDWFTIDATNYDTVPNNCSNLSLEKSENTVTITWKNNYPSYGGISGNEIQIQKDDGDWNSLKSGSVFTEYTNSIEGVDDAKVRYRVKSSNGVGSSGWTYSSYIYTPPSR